MKRLLGPLLLVALLTACGDDGGDVAEDAGASPSSRQTSSDASTETSTDEPGHPEVIDIVPGTAAGGEVTTEVTVIDDEQALERYLRQFDSPPFVGELTAVVQDNQTADGRVLGLAVIAIGCDVPPTATVTEEDGVFVVTPGKVPAPHKECYAPVTSVAVLDLPA